MDKARNCIYRPEQHDAHQFSISQQPYIQACAFNPLTKTAKSIASATYISEDVLNVGSTFAQLS